MGVTNQLRNTSSRMVALLPSPVKTQKQNTPPMRQRSTRTSSSDAPLRMRRSKWEEMSGLASVLILRPSRYPNEVIITDIIAPSSSAGDSTPAGEPGDDFFSSWDKPAIKRPSNPPSRTATPPVISRTASPFLNPGGNSNGTARPKSPLVGTDNESGAAPQATRTTSSSAIRKTAATSAPRKANILGAKKTQKLGVQKASGAEAIDFEAAEKKAKEEAERIERLGYDPEAEQAASVAKAKAVAPAETSKIAAPTPVSPGRAGGFGATGGKERSSSDVERLGMGVGRLGFGQVGGAKNTAAPRKMGFGSTGTSRSAADGISSSPRSIPSPRRLMNLQRTKRNTPARNSATRKASRRTSSSAATTSTRPRRPRPRADCRASKARRRSRVTPTSAGPKTTCPPRTSTGIMATSRVRRGTLCVSSALRPVMIWTI